MTCIKMPWLQIIFLYCCLKFGHLYTFLSDPFSELQFSFLTYNDLKIGENTTKEGCQIAVNCYKGKHYVHQTYVSKECDFIEKVTKNEVKCESIAPIYEQPTTTTKILPQTQALIISNPQSSSLKIGLEMALFIIFLIFFCF